MQLAVTPRQSRSALEIETETRGLTRLDLYLDGRPIESRDVNDGTHTFEVDLPSRNNLLELAGYNNEDFVAARKLGL